MDTAEDKLAELIPGKMFDACLRALSLADTGSSRTCSFIINGNNNKFSNTAISSASKQKYWVICWMERYVLTQLAVG